MREISFRRFRLLQFSVNNFGVVLWWLQYIVVVECLLLWWLQCIVIRIRKLNSQNLFQKTQEQVQQIAFAVLSVTPLSLYRGGCPNVACDRCQLHMARKLWKTNQHPTPARVFMNLCRSTSGNIACGTYRCHNNYNYTVAMPCYFGTQSWINHSRRRKGHCTRSLWQRKRKSALQHQSLWQRKRSSMES